MCFSKLLRHDLLDRQLVDFDFDLEWDKCDYVDCPPFANPDKLTNDLNIIHWNIRGLSGKIDSLRLFLNRGNKQISRGSKFK